MSESTIRTSSYITACIALFGQGQQPISIQEKAL